MAHLQPLPVPGLAIFPQFIPSTPLELQLEYSSMGSKAKASLPDGSALFSIETGTMMSLSHRQTVYDANGAVMFQVRKQDSKHYYAEAFDDGPRLFETMTHVRSFHRPENTVRFANQADMNQSIVELEFVPVKGKSEGALRYGGQDVVVIQKYSARSGTGFRLAITPGLDPALVVGVVIAMKDKAEPGKVELGLEVGQALLGIPGVGGG